MVSGFLCLKKLDYILKYYHYHIISNVIIMNNKFNIFLRILLLLSIAIIVFYFLNYNYYIFTIKTFPDEKVFFQKIISPNQRFAFVYIHSVAQTPVWEFFEVDNEGRMILIETHFSDHGAGLPYAAFGKEIFVSEDSLFKIKNMHREIYLPLYYRVYKDRGNVFIFEKKEFNLSDRIGDALLEINIYKSNIFDYFLGNIRVKEK